LIFGWGLLISEMVQPAKVVSFLDIFGAWDPSLAVVMIAALVVSVPGFRLAHHRERPILAIQSVWPTKTGIDRPLVIGSAQFGIGWGLVWIVSRAGSREPCDTVAARDRFCRSDDRRNGAA
jgi:uncharacterized membrane protein YedE/YeeE